MKNGIATNGSRSRTEVVVTLLLLPPTAAVVAAVVRVVAVAIVDVFICMCRIRALFRPSCLIAVSMRKRHVVVFGLKKDLPQA